MKREEYSSLEGTKTTLIEWKLIVNLRIRCHINSKFTTLDVSCFNADELSDLENIP